MCLSKGHDTTYLLRQNRRPEGDALGAWATPPLPSLAKVQSLQSALDKKTKTKKAVKTKKEETKIYLSKYATIFTPTC